MSTFIAHYGPRQVRIHAPDATAARHQAIKYFKAPRARHHEVHLKLESSHAR